MKPAQAWVAYDGQGNATFVLVGGGRRTVAREHDYDAHQLMAAFALGGEDAVFDLINGTESAVR